MTDPDDQPSHPVRRARSAILLDAIAALILLGLLILPFL